MSCWHEGPLTGFDLETTGTDPETARIVTAAVVWRGTLCDGEAGWLVNPGVDIPEEAARVHGVTTERARQQGMNPAEAIREICARLESAMDQEWPLVIYNAPYDLTVLDRETRRHGLPPFADAFSGHPGYVIDPLVLDKHIDPYRRGKRTLSAACAHYTVALAAAHESGADAIGAMRVAWRIGRLHPDLARMALRDLHELQVKAKARQAASFQDYLRRQGKDEVINDSWPLVPYAGDVPCTNGGKR